MDPPELASEPAPCYARRGKNRATALPPARFAQLRWRRAQYVDFRGGSYGEGQTPQKERKKLAFSGPHRKVPNRLLKKSLLLCS